MTSERAAARGDAAELSRVFEPRSIAIVGASADPGKRGYQILLALRESAYAGDVHPINPKGGRILDHEVLTSIDDLPEGVDLAVLCTPASAAPDLVRACGARGVGAAVVLAVGFGESGDTGSVLERRVAEAARESGVRIVGPNTSGLLNLRRGVNLVGARGVRAGGLALLLQSGNVALSLMTEVTERSWDGISIYLGVGNELDVGFAEALDFLEGHDETHAVIAYVEGLRDARALLSAAARVTRRKPVVVVKSGRTRAGVEAAISHTGAVSGPYDRFSAGLRQAGVVEITRTDELLHVAETLGRQPPCRPGRGIVLFSDGGGQGTLAADTLVEAGAELATLSEATRAALRELLGPAAAIRNPVDVAGATDADPSVFSRALDLILADDAVGAVLLVGLFGGYGIRFAESLAVPETEAGVAMAEAARRAGKGLVVHTMYAAHRSAPLEALGTRGVPVIGSLEVACRCVVELQRRGHALGRPAWEVGSTPPVATRLEVAEAVRRARAGGSLLLTEPEARALLSGAGLDPGPAVVADSEETAASALAELGGPVALKLVSSVITHKSEAGGVVLGIDSPEGACEGYRQIMERASAYSDTHRGEGGREAEHGGGHAPTSSGATAPGSVLVVPMLPPPRLELLVGAYRDAHLGPVLTLGAGGIWVEALADVTHRVLPVSDEDLARMLGELRVSALLAGGRGQAAIERAPIVAALRAVAALAWSTPEIAEVEVNPLFVYEERVAVVDARVVLTE